jgi:hypothetical protein
MISEWMKVMLEEISRKKAEEEQARIEERRRHGEDADLKAPPPGRAANRSGV